MELKSKVLNNTEKGFFINLKSHLYGFKLN